MTTPELLINEIAKLRRRAHEADTLQNCKLLAEKLLPYTTLLGSILLLAYSPGTLGRELRLLRTASFMLDGNKCKSFTNKPLNQKNFKDRGPQQVAAECGFDDKNCIILALGNSACYFKSKQLSPRAEIRELMAQIAYSYNFSVLRSINYENFIGGQIYYYSKPARDGELHPKFTSVDGICEVIRSTFGLDANYFVFTGQRYIKSVHARELRTTSGRAISATSALYKSDEFKRDLLISINQKQPIQGYERNGSLLYYCIFPIFDPSMRGSPIEGVVLLKSGKRIPRIVFRSADTWIREYSAKRHIEQSIFIRDFRVKADQLLASIAGDTRCGRACRRERLAGLLDEMCHTVCRLTNGQSAAVRILERNEGYSSSLRDISIRARQRDTRIRSIASVIRHPRRRI